LTRRRSVLLADRSREKQRMEKLLEDAGVKLSAFITDIFGSSGRAMLDALVRGERDGAVLAELALGRMRPKLAVLTEALTGRFDEHHAFIAAMILRHVDQITAMVGELDERIAAEIAPYQQQVDLLDTIDGVDVRTAQVIIAETGADMAHFTTAAHLASWAGICPGNNKTAGKAKSGHTRPGNRWLKAALGAAALGAIRKKNSYTNALFRRIAARRGGKRAQAAVAHSLLVTAWHILTTNTGYHDLGGDYFLNRINPDHRRRRAIATLERLGYHVTLEPHQPDQPRWGHFRVKSRLPISCRKTVDRGVAPVLPAHAPLATGGVVSRAPKLPASSVPDLASGTVPGPQGR
jgi:transposase